MKNLLLFLLLIISLLPFSCKKAKSPSNPAILVSKISGNVILPDSTTTLDVNTFKVLSPIDINQVINGKYEVKAYENVYNTTLVTSGNGNVVMMGYNIPGNTDFSISVASTALAMIMNTPNVLSLSPNGKQLLISKILSDPNLSELESAIKSNLNSGKNLFDTTNVLLQQKLGALFQSVSHRKTTKPLNSPANSPITFDNIGRDFTFYNGENCFCTVTGIYENGHRIKKIVLDGEQAFPASIEDLLVGKGTLIYAPNPNDNYPFTFPDGQIEVRIRTGFPGNEDGSVEYTEALEENCKSLGLMVLGYFLPFADQKNVSCISNIGLNIYGQVKDLSDAGSNESIIYTISEATFDNVESLAQCFGTSEVLDNLYFKSFEQFFKFAGKIPALLGGSLNIGFYARQ